jgi:hypothetical protein
MSIAALIERAIAVEREMQEARRAAFRSPPVPFIPKAPPHGWLDLEGEVEEMFAEFTDHSDALADAYEQLRSKKLEVSRDHRRLIDGLAQKSRRARAKAWGALVLASGRCCSCAEPRDPKSKWYCTAHLAKRAAIARARWRQRREQGLPKFPSELMQGARITKLKHARRAAGVCVDCTEPAMPGSILCATHKETTRRRSKANREKALAEGRCERCLRRPATHGQRCDTCREKDCERVRAQRARLAAEGRCTRCRRRPATHGQRCDTCREKDRESERARRAGRAGAHVQTRTNALARPAPPVESLGHPRWCSCFTCRPTQATEGAPAATHPSASPEMLALFGRRCRRCGNRGHKVAECAVGHAAGKEGARGTPDETCTHPPRRRTGRS